MVNHPEDDRLGRIVENLDRLKDVPTEVLAEIFRRDGLCLWAFPDGDPPELTGVDTPDRELAAWLCAGCPVQAECLELELRTAGENTVGVWGALPEQDRRALYPLWRTPRDHRFAGSLEGRRTAMTMHLTPIEVMAGLGGLLALITVWRLSIRAARRAADTARAGARLVSLTGRVAVTGAVIAGVQWIVITHPGNPVLVWVALGLPALLAGYTLTKALTVTTTDTPRRRGGRR